MHGEMLPVRKAGEYAAKGRQRENGFGRADRFRFCVTCRVLQIKSLKKKQKLRILNGKEAA